MPCGSPVEIIAGTPPGGGQDRAARALAGALGFAATVTNLPGRGGGNAWDLLAGRRGDAHVVSISSPTLITNRALGVADIDHTDLTALGHLCTEFLAFAVGAGSPIRSARALAEAMGDGLVVSLATARGNVNHLAAGMVAKAAGRDPRRVTVRVFDAAPPAVADLLEGNAGATVVSAASVLPAAEKGSVRVLAVSSAHRLPAPFSETPTWTEEGIDCVMGTWRGVVGAPGLTVEQIRAWDEAVATAVTADGWQAALETHRWSATHLAAAATVTFLDEERRRLERALIDLGVTDG